MILRRTKPQFLVGIACMFLLLMLMQEKTDVQPTLDKSLLRSLIHMCGFKPNFCCYHKMTSCYVCTDNCLATPVRDYRLDDPYKFTGASCNTDE